MNELPALNSLQYAPVCLQYQLFHVFFKLYMNHSAKAYLAVIPWNRFEHGKAACVHVRDTGRDGTLWS